jgi:hypothetical protein
VVIQYKYAKYYKIYWERLGIMNVPFSSGQGALKTAIYGA